MGIQDFKQQNTIAYDEVLREKLKTLHNLLGSEITDVAIGAMNYGIKFNPEAKGLLKQMSEVTSALSVNLMDARNDKKMLTTKEEQDFESIKELTGSLGNLQFTLNRIIQKADEFRKVAEELQEMGASFAQQIADTQEKFRTTRANINDLAILSVNPEIADQYANEVENRRIINN